MKTIHYYIGLALVLLNIGCCANKAAHSATELTGNEINKNTIAVAQEAPAGILEKYWKLVELNGKILPKTDGDEREAHMILKQADNKVFGNGGCNSFSANYTLIKGNNIRISGILSTKMACENGNFENEFFNVLSTADSYMHRNDSLLLSKGNLKTIAVFIEKPNK